MAKWSNDLKNMADKVEADLVDFQKDLATQALDSLVLMSPVDSGAYRGNHRVSINGTDDDVGEVSQASNKLAIQSLNRPGSVTIQNNLPYARRLEEGHSKQAPGGIYSVTFNNLKERADS